MTDVLHVLARVAGTVVCFSAALLQWAWAVRREERPAGVPPRRRGRLSRSRGDGPNPARAQPGALARRMTRRYMLMRRQDVLVALLVEGGDAVGP